MLKQIRIDSLLLFLFLGIVFLWCFFPDIKSKLLENEHYTVIRMSLDEQLDFPAQGKSEEGKISVYNDNLQLLYSVNGGDDYLSVANNKLSTDEIQNPAIIYQNTSIRWRHPKGSFPTLRTVLVKLRDEKNKTESRPRVLTYFSEITSDFPIINISARQGDLFSWERGIMVYGSESSIDDGFQKDWWYRSANFASRGVEWGRAVYFQYFEKGQLQTEQKCEIRISGNATRYFPQKSLKLFPLDNVGKKGRIDFPFFGDDGNKKFESLLLRHSGNDNNKTLFADLLMNRLASGANVLVQNGFPVSVYINGNYWGIYNFRERFDSYLIAKKEGVSKEDVTILQCEGYGDRTLLKEGRKKEKQAFDSLILSLSQETFLSKKGYDEIRKEVSVKSFIDYIIFETFYANNDWLHNNTMWYKAKDKKWKWLLNDLDFSLAYPGENNVNTNLFEKLKKNVSVTAQLFNALMSNADFNARFKNRAEEIIATNFSDNSIDEHYFSLKKRYETEIDQHIRRWRFMDSHEQWEKDCEKNATFLRERRTIFLKQVEVL